MLDLQDPRMIRLDGSTRDLLSRATASLEDLEPYRPLSEDAGLRLRKELLPDRIVATLNMEGIVATRRQTLAVMDAMRIHETVGRGEVEISNTLRAHDFVSEAVDQGVQLSESFIREVNRILLEDLRPDNGEFRRGPVELPGAPFSPPCASDVPALIAQLCELAPLSAAQHPIVQAAWLHDQFTAIHPFSDGNGRVGRLLQDFVLLQRGLLPIGIPPSRRDDYYSALENADRGAWDKLVELLSLMELSVTTKTLRVLKEPERRAAWIQNLSTAAASKHRDTQHKSYVVWRQRMENVTEAFSQAARALDEASEVIGAEFREYGVPEFLEWQQICKRGYISQSWLFSMLLFAERQPFYKTIAHLHRHVRHAADRFDGERDLVALYLTGSASKTGERPAYLGYDDPHIRLRELVFVGDDLFVYEQEGESWNCGSVASVEEVVERFFRDVFERKAGLAGG